MEGECKEVKDKCRKRHYCWTLNLDRDDYETEYQEFRDMQKLKHEPDDYHVFQLEVAPTTGQPHVQGCTVWKNPCGWVKMKKYFGPSVHIEDMFGSPQQARKYCTKEKDKLDVETGQRVLDESWIDGTQEELGDCPVGQGARTDLVAFKQAIDEGKNEKELWNEHFSIMLRYRDCVTRYTMASDKPLWKHKKRPEHDPWVMVLWGPTGSGKSKRARELCEEYGGYWRSGLKGDWWDGYQGETFAVLDEFDPTQVSVDMLKVWTDRYPCQVAPKGKEFVPLLVENWVITSQHHPRTWYRLAAERDQGALARRFRTGGVYEYKVKESEVVNIDWGDQVVDCDESE